MTFKFLSLLHKDFLLLIHSKLSYLIVFIGPILLMLLMGTFLSDTSIKNIQTGVYSQDKDEFYNSFVSKLRENSFLIHEDSTLQNCMDNVESSKYHLCVEVIKKTGFAKSLST